MSIEGFNGEENYYPHPTSNKHKGDPMSNLLPKEPPRDNPYLVPCELCGIPTAMLGTKRCHPCWQLEQGIAARPMQARKLLGVKKVGGYKGDVMEGREWKVDDYEINDGQRSIVRAPHPNEFPGLTQTQRASVAAASKVNLTLIATEHNQHTTLVAQRDRLASVLRRARAAAQIRSDLHERLHGTPTQESWTKDADNALATVEQGHERRAGDGSEQST